MLTMAVEQRKQQMPQQGAAAMAQAA